MSGAGRAGGQGGAGGAGGVGGAAFAGAVGAVGAAGADEPRGVVGDEERAARVALTRVVEPGDEVAGGWLRELGPVGLLARLRSPEGGPLPGASAVRMRGLRTRAVLASPAADLAAAAEAGARFVCPGEPEWPRQLDDLADARPVGLWIRGGADLRLWALRSVAVVGARACTEYGAHVAAGLGAELARRGWVVVSGAAYGVDGAAHRGALGADGATVAVLACGVDVAYPRGHTDLLAGIAERGLVVCELAPGDHPTAPRFVQRNRVIAALTRGTVVVEAELRSGSLVTARAAYRLGRHVMGVPGPVTSGLSAGVHELLRAEGTVVTDADDVVELVGDMGETAPVRSGPVVPRDLLAPAAARVLEALPGRGALAVAEVARGAGTTPEDALARLYELQSLGFAERDGQAWKLAAGSRADARRGPRYAT
ncbi:DNA-processing protein DprA [Streptomyces sp. NPDC060194]|uniref:DNA-processing protein DprA n=1 Tax=Streptomyces sp. NPDC060194 TaxID=3347069 RepID=UPI0036492E0C